MADEVFYPYDPDYVCSPGMTLREWIGWSGTPEKSLPPRLQLSEEDFKLLLSGDLSVNATLANRLEVATDIPISFWLNMEHNYRVGLAAGKEKIG